MKPGKDASSSKIRLRKHLNADALVRAARREFEKIPDPRKGRPGILFADAAMSAFAMFSLKDPSLPAFKKRRSARAVEFWHAAEDNPETLHYFRFVNDLPLNKSHPDLRVNLFEYRQVTPKGLLRFSWVTDILIRRENAVTLMRIGRARRLLQYQPRSCGSGALAAMNQPQ
jgi:hypothetical protein